MMPSRAFMSEGVVHMAVYYTTFAYCGAAATPYGVSLCSTDAVREYAQLLAVMDDEVTCLTCLVEMDDDRFAP